LGNQKVYHMDINQVLGKDTGAAGDKLLYSKKRFDESKEPYVKSGPLINQYNDEIHDNLNVSFKNTDC